jgi:hypothetical protein
MVLPQKTPHQLNNLRTYRYTPCFHDKSFSHAFRTLPCVFLRAFQTQRLQMQMLIVSEEKVEQGEREKQ